MRNTTACPECDGTGVNHWDTWRSCTRCHGTGLVARKPARTYYMAWAERHDNGFLYPYNKFIMAASLTAACRIARTEATQRGHTALYLRAAEAPKTAKTR